MIRPANGAYDLQAVIRVVLASELRKVLAADDMAAACRDLERSGAVAELAAAAPGLREGDRLDLVVQPESGRVLLARSDADLARATRYVTAPRPVIVISPVAEIVRVVDGFWNRALETPAPAARRRGRPRTQAVEAG